MRRSSHGRSSAHRRFQEVGTAVASLLLAAALSPARILGQDPGTGGQKQDSHPVAEGDTLWGLSGRYLGSSYEWPRLWSYNPEITNPHWIYPGYVLRLRAGAEGGTNGGQIALAKAGGTQGTLLMRRGGRPSKPGKVRTGSQVYLDKDALKEAARIVGSPEDHMMFSPTDRVYLQLSKGVTVEEGKELLVFRRIHRAELSTQAGRHKTYHAGDGGEIVRVIGALQVESVDTKRNVALAEVTEAIDPIERGFEVTDVPRTMLEVAPKPSTRDVEARIVAATEALGVLGENQVVFISAGSKQGVEVGNRFVVVRQGDRWRQTLYLREELSGEVRPDANPPKDDAYPWEVVGEVRALYVRPESTTGLITEALVEISPGDRVELREGY